MKSFIDKVDSRTQKPFASFMNNLTEVDEVVFGSDLDNSGGTAFDTFKKEQAMMFSGAAGLTTEESNSLLDRDQHVANVSHQESNVDMIVFGRDQDFSGDVDDSQSREKGS